MYCIDMPFLNKLQSNSSYTTNPSLNIEEIFQSDKNCLVQNFSTLWQRFIIFIYLFVNILKGWLNYSYI